MSETIGALQLAGIGVTQQELEHGDSGSFESSLPMPFNGNAAVIRTLKEH